MRVVKHFTIHYVKQHPDHDDLNFFEGGVTGFETDVIYGRGFDDPMIGFVALTLPVRLIMYTLDPTKLRKVYEADPSHPTLAYIHLLRLYERFCILYSKWRATHWARTGALLVSLRKPWTIFTTLQRTIKLIYRILLLLEDTKAKA